MGIKGLETFIDSLYKNKRSASHSQFINNVSLSNIKLVIDANQLPYVICNELYRSNQHGGNYDEIYSKTKEILVALKPFIAKIIFDGSKEDCDKAIKRFKEKIRKRSNLKTEWNASKKHIDTLSQVPPFFFRSILFNLVNELSISYSMSEGMADHAVACYANGANKESQKYTVLSHDSYFYAYNLEKGYITFKYFSDILRKPNKLNLSTLVPVFHISSLLNHLNLKSYQTWLYFCVLLGDNDIHLNRNERYFKDKKINIANGDFINLIHYLKQNETSLIQNNFGEIRSYFNELSLSKIDNLLRSFEFKDNSFKLIDSCNDFDRFVMSIKDINICFLNCMVEDYNQNTVFEMCQENNILKELYSKITDLSVIEYSRLPIKDPKDEIVKKTIHSKSQIENSLVLAYLNKLNETKTNLNDELTLFYTSLALWENWLENKILCNENKSFEIYVDALITNFILIMIKNAVVPGTERTGGLWRLLSTHSQDFSEIIDLYNRIIKGERKQGFFENDLKIVHRINEFQTAYFILNTYSRLLKLNFEFLGPEKFLNGLFVCRYIQKNEKNTNVHKITTLIQRNICIQDAIKAIRKDLNEIKNEIKALPENPDDLIDLIGSITINK